MRRALGLQGGGPSTPHQQRPEQARQRHRFASDGSVPVVVLNRGDSETGGVKDRLAGLESALEGERAAHAGTKRALQEAQAAQQALQTRLAHADLAHNEAIGMERRARNVAEEALAAAQAALQTALQTPPEPRREPRAMERKTLEPAMAELELGEPTLSKPMDSDVTQPDVTEAEPMEAAAGLDRPARKPRAAAKPREPKPVRWWTPSYRAKKS